MSKYLLTFLTWLALWGYAPNALFAQTSDELKKEQQSLENELAQIKKVLETTTKSERASLGDLHLLQRDVALRKRLLQSISRQIKKLDDDISSSSREIRLAEKRVDTLKEKYAKNTVHQYVAQPSHSWWKYLLKNNSLNSSIKMFTYLNRYRRSILQQAEDIRRMKKTIALRIVKMDQQKIAKENTALKKTEEVKALKEKELQVKQVVSKLKSTRKELQTAFKQKQQQQQRLRKQIADAIRREIEEEKRRMREAEKVRKAAEKAKASATTMSSSTPKPARRTGGATPIAYDPTYLEELSKNFVRQKGKMPWPVSGVIMNTYGSDIFEGATVSGKNIGTIFRTEIGASVASISEGIVSSSLLYRGVYTVIIRHGNFFSGYSNMQSINVKRGDVVQAGTIIGATGKSDEGEWGELALQIANMEGNVNPEYYLHK